MNKQAAIQMGLLYGGVSIILFLLTTLMEGGLMTTIVFGMIAIVLMVVFPLVYIRRQREANGGYITFGHAFQFAFIGLLIGGFLYTGFSFLYATVIDTEYVDATVMRTLETQKRWMEGSVPLEKMEETMRVTEEKMRDGFTPVGVLITFGYSVLFYLVLSLLLAAFLKKNPPPFDTSLDSGEIHTS